MGISLTPKQKKVLELIYNFIENYGFSPSLADLKSELKLASNQAILNFLKALEEKGYIAREKGEIRSITILPLGFKLLSRGPLVPMVGDSAAGLYIESFIETNFKWLEMPSCVPDEIIKQSNDVFIIQVHGDSMINIGIDDKDLLLINKSKEFKSGDIVVARTDAGTTVKRFIADGGKRYLKPENPAYSNMIIIPGEVEFQGKVILNLSKINQQ
jgi:repressor LexA